MSKIEIRDKFSLIDLRKTNYEMQEGIDEKRFMQDLLRVFAIIRNHNRPYVIVKTMDYLDGFYNLEFISYAIFKQLLKSINLSDSVNAFNVYNKYSLYITLEGITFNGNREDFFKYFQGYYTRNILKDVNQNRIANFLNFVKEVIATDNESTFKYILNWYSFIVQNPGTRKKKALVLSGKDQNSIHLFTNTLCKLIEPYSNSHLYPYNAHDDYKLLLVTSRISLPKAKRYLLDDYLRINRKSEPKRILENVANLIIVDDKFAKRVRDDNNFIVLDVSGYDLDYLDNLLKTFDDDFYDNLLSYFLKRDLTHFNLKEVPRN